MRGRTIASLVLALGMMAPACSQDAQKQAEDARKQAEEATRQAQKTAEETAKKAQEAAADAGKAANEAGRVAGQSAQQAMQQAGKGLEEVAKGLQALGATGTDGKPIEPISFKELQTVFSPLDGWEMDKPTGSRMAMPVSYSQAEVTYRKGDARINASITDSGFNQILIAPFSVYLTSGFERETANGYEKSVKLAGSPGWEKWDGSDKRGELAAFVNKRFIVHFEGRRIDDTKVLYQLAQASNLDKLASLK